MIRWAALLALVWVGLGLYGAYSYGNAYNTYRGFPPPKDPPGVAPGRLLHQHFYSTALGTKRAFLVYEPRGYAAAAARGQRFPVLYLLHGSPGSPKQFINIAAAGVALDTGIAQHTLRPFLIVMPDGSDGTFRKETEWANTPHGRYESLVLEIKRTVDQRFSTKRGRLYSAIGGNSSGGFGALNIALRHPTKFSIAEAWSGYALQSRRTAFAQASDALIRANSPALYVQSRAAQLRRYPLHAFIYDGRRDRGRHKPEAFARQLKAAGGDVTLARYPGRHDWRLWRAQTPHMLAYADSWFGRLR
jgi:enterochelin esterase-like enzyme